MCKADTNDEKKVTTVSVAQRTTFVDNNQAQSISRKRTKLSAHQPGAIDFIKLVWLCAESLTV
jgi:hypothetical protein